MRSFDIHLVGSIPLGDAQTVFETVTDVLGPRLLCIPDGETGERAGWMGWLDADIRRHPDLEVTDETFQPHTQGRRTSRYRLKSGVPPERLAFSQLRHADFAIDSYRIFSRLKDAGIIPAACRFQFALAHPIAVATHYAVEALQPAFEQAYEQGLLAQIQKMLTVIPSDQLAIQWDVASAIFAPLQNATPTRHGRTKQEMLETFSASCVRLSTGVPAAVNLIYHLCYGDSNHRHAVEPVSTADMVDVATRVSAGVCRTIELFHMPVPRDRSDDDYFQPLSRLVLRPETRISLGLVHMTDGQPGAERRISAAQKQLEDFLIATECGFGRRPPDTIPALLELHARLAGLR
jgi:hypothetical protein